MEPLSRPLHRKQASFSKKLSNANSFSGKNAYDDVFAGTPKFGARTHSATIEDYKEIFGGSQASSIPILDLSALDGAKVSSDARRSNLDYSKIFGGFHDEDIAVSYEEMLAKPKGAKNFSDEARTSPKTASPSDGPNQLNRYKEEAFQHAVPNQSFEGMKQVNMSYHKTGQRSNDKTNERTHVAQLRDVPGFTCFIDGNHPLQKTEGDKPVPLAKTDVKPLPKIDANRTQKKTSDIAGKFKSQSSWNEFNSTDKPLSTNESNLKTHLPKMSSPSGMPANLVNNKREPKRSMDSNFKIPRTDACKAGYGNCSPSFSDEEVDVNSAAAASAAALRKAIQKAQASIRIAKELMERKKDGAQRFSKPSSNDVLDGKKRKEDQVNTEANKLREKNAKEICENADVILQVFTKSERGKARRSGKVAPDFKESEEMFISKEVIGETNKNKLESADDCEELRQHSRLVDTDGGRNATFACEHADGGNNITPSVRVPESEKKEIGTAEETREQLDGKVEEVDEEAQELEDLEGKENTFKMAGDWEQHVYRLDINHTTKEVYEHGETEKTGTAQEDKKTKEMHRSSSEESLEPNENVEVESQEEKANNNEEGLDEAQKCLENEMKQEVFEEQTKQSLEDAHEEGENRLKKICDQDGIEMGPQADCEWVDCENVEVESREEKANSSEGGFDEAQKCLENEMKQEVFEEQNKQSLKDAHEEGENRLKKICDRDGIQMGPQADCEWVDCEEAYEVESYEKRQNDSCEAEDNQIRLDEIHELEINNKRLNATADGEENERQEVDINWEGKEEIPMVEACEYEETESIHSETIGNEFTEESMGAVEETMNFDATSDAFKQDAGESLSESEEFHRCKENDNDLNCEENERISDVTQSSCEFKEDENEWEAIEVAHVLGEKEICKTGGFVEGAAEHIEIENKMKDATEAFLFNDNSENNSLSDTISEPKQTDQGEKESDLASNLGSGINVSVCESGKDEKNVQDKIASDLEEVKSNFDTGHEKREWAETGEKIETSQPPSVFKGEEKTKEMDGETEKSQITEQNEENLNKTLAVEKKKSEETEQKEVKAEKEHLRKSNEAEAIKRERERDRIAVERAIREARERAFAEARERAERAAVERATAEARQRVMAEAREKYEKASTSTKSSTVKASIEAKLRAERAAVERATAEARERALERALSQKATSGAREQAERIAAEKFSGVSRDNGMRQSFPSSDAQKLDGNNGESAQRCKARLESHQRITERAAKALAEKNRRDLLAQKEQAERNRLAETLDAEVKRWSSGKEGNLRALLSTLQYILGPDSGWQPISLTDIITTNAVKKAYRKATLHVHPDKLQQRGASIQQKYTCEKVFDLLKAAWNKFNFEER